MPPLKLLQKPGSSLAASETADHVQDSRSGLQCQHALQYLQEHWAPVSACSSCRFWSVSSSLLAVLRTRTNYGDYSFAVYGSRVWNSLPDEVRSPDITLTTFRNKLKYYLMCNSSFAHLWHPAKLCSINVLNNNNALVLMFHCSRICPTGHHHMVLFLPFCHQNNLTSQHYGRSSSSEVHFDHAFSAILVFGCLNTT